MKEVKDICDQMLADPAPPMTSADDLLSFARRGRARHRARLGAGIAAATTLAVASAVPLLINDVPATRPPIDQAAPATSAAPAPVPVPVPVRDLVPVGFDNSTETGSTGVIYMRIVPDTPAPAGDLCRAPLPMVFKVPITPGPCEVITLQGKQIRLGSYRSNTPDSPEVSFALRYLEGKVYICVQVPPGQMWDSGNTTVPVMTARELAEFLLRVR